MSDDPARLGLAESDDWMHPLLGAIPPGSRVLVMGAFPRALLGALSARNCRVSLTGEPGRAGPSAVREAVDAQGADEVDAILLPALYGPAIDKVLATGCRLLAEGGRVVALVRNAAYAGHRLDMLRGRLARVDLAALLLPLDAAEALLTDAGLTVVERFPITRPLEIDAAAAVREELLAHPDALAWAHVVVAVPAPLPPSTGGVDAAAALRHRVAELTLRAGELDAALRDRIAELEAIHQERRHLEMDVAVKDAFIGEVLERLASVEAELARREAWIAELQQMTRHRIADVLHARISSVPPIHRPLRAAARWQRERAGRRGQRG
ncbi:MAG TPA: hypothetical protein VN193_13345 [Candidatus Angelobacter sp.]|jgi:hypothetical protein|nr:hypothetical protein [Candidatus Angelobacter sp.]